MLVQWLTEYAPYSLNPDETDLSDKKNQLSD